jgi:glyoxylase-like metal-dependent hydrolase (beta-lactamase superfamily II)
MNVKRFQGGYDKNFCYVVSCSETKAAAIIDPSVEINPVIEYIESNDLILDKILITHTHHDHIYYLSDFIDLYPLMKVYASANARLPKAVDFKKIEHNDVVMVGKHFILSLFTPGHYMDSICYWVKSKNIIFTGDTMFVGRTGRTISGGSNIKELYHSTYDILLKLPTDTVIYPGHHYGFCKDITLKENMKLSNFFQCKNFSEFDIVMKNFEKSRKK